MKRIVLIVALTAIAHTAIAGLSYKFESVTTGIRESTISGSAAAEGSSFRMNVNRGDGFTFNDGSFVISRDGGQTLLVADPATKTYYELALADATGSAAAMFKQLGFLNFKISEPKVSRRDLGKGEAIEGYPTRRTQVSSSYTMSINAIGMPMKIAVRMSTESWLTEAIPAELTNFLQKQSITTGIAEIDKLIVASGGEKGFPLRQVTTFSMTQNGRVMDSKTTTTIHDVAKKPFADSEFVIPSSFKKTDNPIEKMMKALGAQ
jgi:hypothetical protein